MSVDFVVVFSVRQRFGDAQDDDFGLEVEAPFVGAEKEFSFQCPRVNSNEQSILLFQSQGVNVRQQMQINGEEIFGGIPTSIDLAPLHIADNPIQSVFLRFASWKGNVMLIHPGVLRESNVLRIRANIAGSGNLDNFILDNCIVIFKTHVGTTSV